MYSVIVHFIRNHHASNEFDVSSGAADSVFGNLAQNFYKIAPNRLILSDYILFSLD